MKATPSPKDFFLESPLYRAYHVTTRNFGSILELEFYQGTLDAFCFSCNRKSVFSADITLPEIVLGERTDLNAELGELVIEEPENTEAIKNAQELLFRNKSGRRGEFDILKTVDYALMDRYIAVSFECTRNPEHLLLFYLSIKTDDSVTRVRKVGQDPSVADLAKADIKKYQRELDKDHAREFFQAIGLFAHGVGIGAFVYLRRIFERLVEEAHLKASQSENWNEESFMRQRMDGKILLLKEFLPDLLVDNYKIYSVLSKGIHELSEEECLDKFRYLRMGIELILDERIREKEIKNKKDEFKKGLNSL